MAEKKELNIKQKLLKMQNELKCNKSQYNNFGKYKYRSCEDILEAVKPLCAKYGALLTLTDTVYPVADRFYVNAKATLTDVEGDGYMEAEASAREPAVKKGMDESQITGTASSYARKYALGALFCLDDTKDTDTNEYTYQTAPKGAEPKATAKAYKCENCGKDFKPFKDANGKVYTAEEIYNINKAKSTDGVVRCKACREAMENTLNTELKGE